jgi:hypothetical protein
LIGRPAERPRRRSCGADVGVSLFKFPFDAITVDGIEKPNPFDDVANLFLRLYGVAVCRQEVQWRVD